MVKLSVPTQWLRKGFIILCLIVCGFAVCAQQPAQEFKSEEFKWTIAVPAGFEQVDPEELRQSKKNGKEMMEKTTGQSTPDKTIPLCAFKTGRLNRMEVNYQPYTNTEGAFLKENKKVNNVLYETFRSIPDMKIDTASTRETVADLEFYCFHVKMERQDRKMNSWIFTRLFGQKLLAVSITYMDEAAGAAMLDAWRNSRFEK